MQWVITTAAASVGVGCLAPAVALGQVFPSKSIRIIVPYVPGGGTDATARPIAAKLSERLGQPVVVDNRGGASGMIGALATVKSPPDGYTLMISASGEVALNVALFAKMAYDPVQDLAPMTLATLTPTVLVVHPSVPIKTAKEYIAIAKAKPGSMQYGSIGLGSPHHFAGEWLRMLTGVNIVHVPYKGSGPEIIDLLGGHIPSGFATLLPVMQHVKAGKMRALAVTTAKRAPLLPDVPALAETLPGFDVSQWFAVWAPVGVPKDILDKLTAEIRMIVQSADYKARMTEQGTEAIGGTPAELAVFQKAEIDKFRKIARQANIKVE